MKRERKLRDPATRPAKAKVHEASPAAIVEKNGDLPDELNGDRTEFESSWDPSPRPVQPGSEDLSAALFDPREVGEAGVGQADPSTGGLHLSEVELSDLHSTRDFIQLLRSKNVDVRKIKASVTYEYELESLQIEMVKLQRWIQEQKLRVAVLFEGRDAAGKGGTIRRFIEHLNPRAMRVVALPTPSTEERGQWYFQRYMKHLPNEGEVVFFDRSWYNRAVVEPVNGFCTREQYDRFMQQVPEFEHMLVEDGVTLVKFWFSISRDVQIARFESRRVNLLKQWKLSPLDAKAQELWDSYTKYKEIMFSRTHNSFSPWIIVKANNKRAARLESMRHLLSLLDYAGKDDARVSLFPDPNIVTRFHRGAVKID